MFKEHTQTGRGEGELKLFREDILDAGWKRFKSISICSTGKSEGDK